MNFILFFIDLAYLYSGRYSLEYAGPRSYLIQSAEIILYFVPDINNIQVQNTTNHTMSMIQYHNSIQIKSISIYI